MASSTTQITEHLKSLYAIYFRTADPDGKLQFYSPECMQICRPEPSYAARDRETIVQYVREAAVNALDEQGQESREKSTYTIRPLRDDEFVFETDEIVSPIGYKSAELQQKAQEEGWMGMRVDLLVHQGFAKKLLVEVQYWWRKEGEEWVQILHDIMYMGPSDRK